MMPKIFLSFFVMLPLLLCSAQLWSSRNWQQAKPDGTPNGAWDFDDLGGSCSFVPATDNEPAMVVMNLDQKGDATLTCREEVRFAKNSRLTIAGEYRTVDYEPGNDGTIIANIAYNFGLKEQTWQCVFLNPTAGKWESFSNSKRIPAEAKGPFRAYFHIKGKSGGVQWQNLSLETGEDSTTLRPEFTYVWREAENLYRFSPPYKDESTSGKGAVNPKPSNPFAWKFRIAPVTDSTTLFDKNIRYSIWGRMYGYLGNPEVKVFFNRLNIASIQTVANEKADAMGNYAGPGDFYWQYLGSFERQGGSHSIKLESPRLCLDALLVTDDPMFHPQAMEARQAVQARFTDVVCTHEVYSDFAHCGVAPEIATPVTFRITKPTLTIPAGAKPAKFHFSVPDSIEVVEATTMRATVQSGQSTWNGRKLEWRRSGSSTFNGVAMDDYEMDLYYLCGNQHWWFLRVKEEAFQENKRVPARYWLENGGEKQTPETLWLTMVRVPRTAPFNKIFVGGGGASFFGFWEAWKGLFDTSLHAGINAFACWGFEEAAPDTQSAFINKAKERGVRVFGAMSPFWHAGFSPAGNERGMGIDGNYCRSRSNLWAPTFALDENATVMKKMCEHLKKGAAAGLMGTLLDDEWSNQIFDLVDYTPETKELFRKYLQAKGQEYVDPVTIVQNKKTMKALHKQWVAFRCERMAEFYRIWKAAYVSGLTDKSDSMFMTGIQGKNPDPELIQESNFFDYRLLAKHCDFIGIMCYMYRYIPDSAVVGDTLAMYNRYVGRPATFPALLCDYEGHEVPPEQKASLKYQLWEALMQQSRVVEYWMSYGMYNPLNLREIAEGIRQLVPFEDILLEGLPCEAFASSEKWLRLQGLKRGKKLLLYAANYQHPATEQAVVTIRLPVKSVIALANSETVSSEGNRFCFDSARDRGQLFLIELSGTGETAL